MWTRPFLKATLYFVHSLPSRGGEGSCESMNQSILTKINASFSLMFEKLRDKNETSFFLDLISLAGNSHFCMSLDRGNGNDSLGKKIMRSIIRLFFSIAYFKGYVFLI